MSFFLIFGFSCLLWRVMWMRNKPLWMHALANLCPPCSTHDEDFAQRLFYPLIGMWRGMCNLIFTLILTLAIDIVSITFTQVSMPLASCSLQCGSGVQPQDTQFGCQNSLTTS